MKKKPRAALRPQGWVFVSRWRCTLMMVASWVKKSARSYLPYLLTSYVWLKGWSIQKILLRARHRKLWVTPCSLVSCSRAWCTRQNHPFSRPATAFARRAWEIVLKPKLRWYHRRGSVGAVVVVKVQLLPYDKPWTLELYPICLLAVWPVSVSYRHLPVGIFGMVCRVFFVL